MLLGIIPGAGGTQRLPRLAGVPLALEMCTAGQHVDAARAHAAGIVDYIVEGDLLEGAIAFALAQAGPRKARDLAAAGSPADFEAARGALRKSARGARAPWSMGGARRRGALGR